jgi:tetratricopeptide (TPR) repeat protein
MTAEEAEEFNTEILNNKDLKTEVHLYRLGQVQRFLSIKDQLKETYKKMVSDGELAIESPIKVETPSIQPSIAARKSRGSSVVVSETKDPSTLMIIVNNSIIFFKKPLGKIAATLLILLTGFLIFNSIENNRKAREMAEEEAKKNELILQARRDSLNNINIQTKVSDYISSGIAESRQQTPENIPAELDKAIIAYERGKFDEATNLLQRPSVNTSPDKNTGEKGVKFGTSSGSSTSETPKPDPTTESYRALYQGLIFLSNQKYDKALDKFKTVGKPVQYEAKWYSALAHLKKGDIKNGRNLLNEIVKDSTGSKYTDAKLILDSLK